MNIKNLFRLSLVLILAPVAVKLFAVNENYSLESVRGDTAKIKTTSGVLGGHKAAAGAVGVKTIEGTVINTANNNVGLEKGDICAVAPVAGPATAKGKLGAARQNFVVVCKSGKVVKDICKDMGAATGTPPWLDKKYKNRYVGTEEPKHAGKTASGLLGKTRTIAGAGHRAIYYECKPAPVLK